MKLGWVMPAVLLVCGCASAPAPLTIDPLFADERFAPGIAVADADELFALDDAMRSFVRRQIQPRARWIGPRLALHEALRDSLTLDYDTAMTRTARQAFAARAGNCLSLVILAGALARELDIPVTYRSVRGYDTWSRDGGLVLLSGHVNLVLGRHDADGIFASTVMDRPLVIDFVENARDTDRRAREISEAMIVAMYLNNRAAELLLAGDLHGAYWHARAAVGTQRDFVSALNTLAVVYLRHGDLPEARQVLDRALQREPGNAQVLTNLVRVLTVQGETDEARLVQQRLSEISKYPPFHFLDRGNAALAAGDIDAAMAQFRKELQRIPYDPELHFAIAVASFRRGDVEEARAHLRLAMHNSTTRSRHDLYAAKLDRLKDLP
ncbi:tetratricopeptide repeat protein [Fontimonas sp. SYSU GA230001]|uniref:tetratricopeptide repeat protein n=1 Tax=Fontimonas sp. SYSU GA230001 TaxID=3142450 RepID=UPI0032B3C180